MSKKKTTQEYIAELEIKNPNLEVLEEYINANTPILHLHRKCNHQTKMSPSDALHGNGCRICRDKNTGDRCRKTNEQYIEELKIENPTLLPLENYISANTPILHYHKNCGHKTKMLPTSALRGSGCVICKGLKISETSRKTHNQFTEELFKVNPNIEILSYSSHYFSNYNWKKVVKLPVNTML